MKILAAFISTETNTFAPFPTGAGSFQEYGVFYGDASTRDPEGSGFVLAKLREMVVANGDSLIESVCAFSQPGGRTVRSVYEGFRNHVLDDLRKNSDVDAVVLILHGAMVAEGYDDCEGDLIKRVRDLVGRSIPIGVELDLHCHLTSKMSDNADVIICFKEYPHTDQVARLEEVYRLVRMTATGAVNPVTAVHDCRMVGLWGTKQGPMADFVQRMSDLEGKDGVLSISLGHGFPWGDVADNGAKLWVITDGDRKKATVLAATLADEFWSLRNSTGLTWLGIDAALDRAEKQAQGPVILADAADNAGGGAPGDSTFVLKRILERGVGNVVLGSYWDLGAVEICSMAGVGARVGLRVGGKCGPASGDPVDVEVTVRAIAANHSQTGLGGARSPLGRSVWVSTDQGVDLLLASVRSQVFSPDAFEGLGIRLSQKRMVILKSTQHFYSAFAPIAGEVIHISAPGAITPDFANIPFVVRDRYYWPRVADPRQAASAESEA